MIKFWKTREKFGCLSNFSKHSILVDGKMYATSEHYYQSKKFEDPKFQETVRLLKTAREAKDIAHNYKSYIKNGVEIEVPKVRPDWESVKYNVMKDALRYKVQQHDGIKFELLSTGEEYIVEDSPFDYTWGIGNGTGKNLLGKAWMEIREEIRNSVTK